MLNYGDSNPVFREALAGSQGEGSVSEAVVQTSSKRSWYSGEHGLKSGGITAASYFPLSLSFAKLEQAQANRGRRCCRSTMANSPVAGRRDSLLQSVMKSGIRIHPKLFHPEGKDSVCVCVCVCIMIRTGFSSPLSKE